VGCCEHGSVKDGVFTGLLKVRLASQDRDRWRAVVNTVP
jgi:hypothetical protein